MKTIRALSMFAPLAILACGSSPDGAQEGATGTISAAIAIVPPGIQCVQVNVGTYSKNFAVTAGTSTVLSLGAVPPGTFAAGANAYAAACSTTLPSASWVAIPQTVNVAAYGTTQLAFEMEPAPASTGTINFVSPVAQLVAGYGATYAVMQDGSVKAWGSVPYYGTLLTPTTLTALTGIKTVTSDYGYSCALGTNGVVQCWGSGASGELGVASENTSSNYAPAVVASASGKPFIGLAGGGATACGLTSSTPTLVDVECWGSNGNNAANGLAAPATLPTPGVLITGTAPQSLAMAGIAGCYIDNTSASECWGYNGWGAFGNGVVNGASALTQAFGGALVTQIAMTFDSACFLKIDGTLWCSGQNDYGQLGTGSTAASSSTPVQVTALSGITQISAGAGGNAVYALRSDGTVWAWGNNGAGQLGNDSTTSSSVPVQVKNLTGMTSIAGGQGSACAIRNDGTVWCWGNNSYGQLGNGTIDFAYVPVQAQL